MKGTTAIKTIVLIIFFLFSTDHTAFSLAPSEYLILEDIGDYKRSPGFELMGKTVGKDPSCQQDGDDARGFYKACKILYVKNSGNPPLSVETRRYQDDRWLLHELEDRYRDAENMNATLDDNVSLKKIGKNALFAYRTGGVRTYTWIADKNVLVEIRFPSYTQSTPEPMEVIKAYLAKFPSMITLKDADLKSKAHSEAWIRNEMEHRLWLCTQWLTPGVLGKVEKNDALMDAVEQLFTFLDYREKYFGIRSISEKELLLGFRDEGNMPAIREKLSEYSTWWNEYKVIDITTGVIFRPGETAVP